MSACVPAAAAVRPRTASVSRCTAAGLSAPPSPPRDPAATSLGTLPYQRGAAQDGGALLPVAPGHVGEQLLEPASRDRIVERKVGPTEEGGSVGREEDGDRIAPKTREELHRGGIALRHVGTLITVDAHGDEQRIDHGAQPGVAVHLAVHHPAPATVVRSHI